MQAAVAPRPSVTSRITVGQIAVPERFGPNLVRAGQVSLISLDAIVERLGESWQGRREAIYDMVVRTLSKRLGETASHVRVSETEFLVAQPDCGPHQAQALCLRALGEVLKHFTGVAAQPDLRVRQVSAIRGPEIIATPVDPATAIKGEGREARATEEANQLAAYQELITVDADLLSPARWTPFVGAHGRKVKVSCKLEPVFELKANGRIGYRLSRQVLDVATDKALTRQEIANLSRTDLLRIDMATIARGLARLESDGDQALSLIIPVSYITLSHQEGRQKLVQAFARARQSVLKGVLCEICDIEGVPKSALLSAVAMIRPWSLFVIGHLTSAAPRADAGMKEAGLQAMAVTCPPNMEGDAEFMGWLKSALTSARKAAKTVVVYGCSPRRMSLAGLMGATHASVGGA